MGYNLYRRQAEMTGYGAPIARPGAEATAQIDASAAYGNRYIYAVTAVANRDPLVESALSVEHEIAYDDRFAPVPPKGLTALPMPGEVKLIWEAVPEADVAGYLVERADTDVVCPDGAPARLWVARLDPLPATAPIAVVFHPGAFDWVDDPPTGEPLAGDHFADPTRLHRDFGSREAFAVLGIYVAFQMVVLASLRQRIRGWKPAGPFSLGRWGFVVNVAALAYGVAIEPSPSRCRCRRRRNRAASPISSCGLRRSASAPTASGSAVWAKNPPSASSSKRASTTLPTRSACASHSRSPVTRCNCRSARPIAA